MAATSDTKATRRSAAALAALVLLFVTAARCAAGESTVVTDRTGVKLTRPSECHDFNCIHVECPHDLTANQRKAHAALTKRNQHRIDALRCWERFEFLTQYSALPYSASDYNEWFETTMDEPPVGLREYKHMMWSLHPELAH